MQINKINMNINIFMCILRPVSSPQIRHNCWKTNFSQHEYQNPTCGVADLLASPNALKVRRFTDRSHWLY